MCEHCNVPNRGCSCRECDGYKIMIDEHEADYFLHEDGEVRPISKSHDEAVSRQKEKGFYLKKLYSGEDDDMTIFFYKGCCIEVQPAMEGGWDYTFYRNGRELDGGVYDDPDASLTFALNEIVYDMEQYMVYEKTLAMM